MDKTAVFLKVKTESTVHVIADNTISVRCTRSNSRGMTVCLPAACDGTIRLSLVNFKGQPNGKIKKKRNILLQNMYGCCQTLCSMGKRSMKTWTDLVWKLYVASNTQLVCSLNDFSCHKQITFMETTQSHGTRTELVHGDFMCALQPRDVVIMKSMNHGIRKHYTE